MLEELTAQEISNISWGLFVLHHHSLLHVFLPKAVSHFVKVVREVDGASWVDFANVTAHLARSQEVGPEANELDVCFRKLVLEPLVAALHPLKDVGAELPQAIEHLQNTIEAVGAPYFGTIYGREVLALLAVGVPGARESWPREARRQCHEKIGEWQIPNMDSILAFAMWEVWLPGAAGVKLLEPGRVFLSGWSEGIDEELKELLHPFMQMTRRDMCAERVAMLELLDAMLKLQMKHAGVFKPELPSDYEVLLRPYEGFLNLYLSHFPSLSSMAVFCQFQRRLPKVQLRFDFDNAWLTCCGVPRFDV